MTESATKPIEPNSSKASYRIPLFDPFQALTLLVILKFYVDGYELWTRSPKTWWGFPALYAIGGLLTTIQGLITTNAVERVIFFSVGFFGFAAFLGMAIASSLL